MPLRPLTTQIVGSYAKPSWLVRPQRMRALDGSWWRPEAQVLQEAREDAVRLAIYEQERAGLDLVTDGEAQRAAYDRHFLRRLTGIDSSRLERVAYPAEVKTTTYDDSGLEEYTTVSELKPRVVAEVVSQGPVAVEELRFLKRHARRPVKANIVGPISLFGQLIDEFYGDERALIMALAAALNEELLALSASGADVLQIDEPGIHFHLSLARRFVREAIARVVQGVETPVIVHVCYGYAFVMRQKAASPTYPEVLELLADCPIAGISLEYEQPRHEPSLLKHCGQKHVIVGLLDLGTSEAETAGHVAERLRAALEIVPPERLHPSSDCGMWFLPRDLAYGKITALVEGTRIIRRELGRLAEP